MVATRTRQRTGTEVARPERYTLASIKISEGKETDPKRIEAIKKSKKDELELLFVELRGLMPVFNEALTGAKPYRCHMFSAEKFLAIGDHDKMKLRLVFNGNEQDADLFPDRASPTAAIHSLITCLAIAA